MQYPMWMKWGESCWSTRPAYPARTNDSADTVWSVLVIGMVWAKDGVIMNIRPIRTDEEYREALKEISPLFEREPEPGTAEGDAFEVMITLIEAYESKTFPIDLPDAIEAIKFRMEQSGLTAADLVPAIGRTNRVYEVLNRKRSLTLPMIWKLHDMFGIPAESLIRPTSAA